MSLTNYSKSSLNNTSTRPRTSNVLYIMTLASILSLGISLSWAILDTLLYLYKRRLIIGVKLYLFSKIPSRCLYSLNLEIFTEATALWFFLLRSKLWYISQGNPVCLLKNDLCGAHELVSFLAFFNFCYDFCIHKQWWLLPIWAFF